MSAESALSNTNSRHGKFSLVTILQSAEADAALMEIITLTTKRFIVMSWVITLSHIENHVIFSSDYLYRVSKDIHPFFVGFTRNLLTKFQSIYSWGKGTTCGLLGQDEHV